MFYKFLAEEGNTSEKIQLYTLITELKFTLYKWSKKWNLIPNNVVIDKMLKCKLQFLKSVHQYMERDYSVFEDFLINISNPPD